MSNVRLEISMLGGSINWEEVLIFVLNLHSSTTTISPVNILLS